MADIPKRIFDIWQQPLKIETCGTVMDMYKLQCSKCDEKFNTENSFAIHIDVCLKNAERDVHYQVHQHANRLLMSQNHLAMFCGASNQEEDLKCGLCKEQFENVQACRMHMRRCRRFNYQFSKFANHTGALFNNLMHSNEQLGTLFQQYVLDEHIIKIKTGRLSKPATEEVPNIESGNEVRELIDDSFNRYLRKRELDSTTVDVGYSLPNKRRRVEEEDEDEEADDDNGESTDLEGSDVDENREEKELIDESNDSDDTEFEEEDEYETDYVEDEPTFDEETIPENYRATNCSNA
eukprot:NP_510326.1 Uncharacterized protein CELE_F48F7.5 [Caenorhabditis elegans]